MAAIKAAWKRTVRLREYESETLELAVERDWDEARGGDAVWAAVDLDRQLAAAGDALVAERLAERAGPPRSAGQELTQRSRERRSPAAPDDLL